ncbi:MAG TPA: glycosyltransferase family 39 protein [Gemmatimonadales bacterium]|nr:glycosyltransferase family 39 protein [Gemmatimonadales bacterium]
MSFTALAVGFLLSTFLELRYLPVREVWLDESHSALLAGMPLGRLLDFVRGDVHPPLYFLLLNGWTRLLGDSPWALRGFSLLANLTAGVVFAMLALRSFGRRAAAVLAGWLFWFSPVVFYYAVEVRMYALAVLWFVLALAALDQILGSAKTASRWAVAGFILSAAAMLYTHYIAGFVLAGTFVFWALEVVGRRAALRPLLIAGTALALLGLPWAPVLLRQRAAKAELRRVELAARADPASLSYGTDSNPDQDAAVRLRSAVENAASIAGIYPARRPWLLALLAIPLVIPLCFGLLRARHLRWNRLWLSVGLLTLTGGLVSGITARRFLILLVPPLILALVEALNSLGLRRRALAVGLALATLTLYVAGTGRVLRTPVARPTAAVVAMLRADVRPGDVVVVSAPYYEILLQYHAGQAGVSLPLRGFPEGIEAWWARQPFKGWGGPAVSEHQLASFIARLRQGEGDHAVWLVLFETRYYDPRQRLLAALREQARSVEPLLPQAASAGQRLYRIVL